MDGKQINQDGTGKTGPANVVYITLRLERTPF
jgi:hypothetical protein